MKLEIQQWEGEGGAISRLSGPASARGRGARKRIEWAQRIGHIVNAELDALAEAIVSFTSKPVSGEQTRCQKPNRNR
jgi:hypothetical protein